MRRLIALLLALAAALAAGGCAVPESTVPVVLDAVYPAAGLEVLQVENQNGAVTVTGWDRDEVQVRALNGRNVENISVENTGDRMTVRTIAGGATGLFGVRAEYEIRVPRALARLELATDNGRIGVIDSDGIIAADTSNGAISLSGTRTLERLVTSNGRIDAEIRELGTDARVSTSNGAIGLLLAPTLNATIEASTSNSQVTVSGLALNLTASSPGEVRGTLGAGGARLVIETSNGAITIGAL